MPGAASHAPPVGKPAVDQPGEERQSVEVIWKQHVAVPPRGQLAARQALLDLLQQPAIAVWVAEGGERGVRPPLGIGAAQPLGRASMWEALVRVVEDLADLYTAGDQIGAGGFEILDDEDEALQRARDRLAETLAEDDRGGR